MKMAAGGLLKQQEGCCRGFQLCRTEEISKPVMPGTVARYSTKRRRQGENRKKASSSLYLVELLIQKCKFRHRFTVSC